MFLAENTVAENKNVDETVNLRIQNTWIDGLCHACSLVPGASSLVGGGEKSLGTRLSRIDCPKKPHTI